MQKEVDGSQKHEGHPCNRCADLKDLQLGIRLKYLRQDDYEREYGQEEYVLHPRVRLHSGYWSDYTQQGQPSWQEEDDWRAHGCNLRISEEVLDED